MRVGPAAQVSTQPLTGAAARRGTFLRAVGALTFLLATTQGLAEDGPWSASIAGTTDYVYRGVSQAYDSGALQMGLNYQDPHGWFSGAWASNVAPYPFGTSAVELDLYTGLRKSLSDQLSAAFTYTRYQYLDDARPARYNYDELSLAVAYRDQLVATVSWQPDSTSYSELGFVAHRSSFAYELSSRWPVLQDFALTGGGGYYDLHRLFGVGYWAANAGAQYTYKHLTIDLSHFFVQSTIERLYEQADANGDWVLTIILRL